MILDILAGLSSAEQFFQRLDVPFDETVVNVSRLHILKRFREVLGTADLNGLADGEVTAVCRAALIEAYEDFAEGRGAKTFKVFKDAVPGFVPLAALRPAAGGGETRQPPPPALPGEGWGGGRDRSYEESPRKGDRAATCATARSNRYSRGGWGGEEHR